MKTFKVTYEFISHDKEGIAYEEITAKSSTEAIQRFNNKGTEEVKIIDVKECA